MSTPLKRGDESTAKARAVLAIYRKTAPDRQWRCKARREGEALYPSPWRAGVSKAIECFDGTAWEHFAYLGEIVDGVGGNLQVLGEKRWLPAPENPSRNPAR